MDTGSISRSNEPSQPIIGITANYHLDSTSMDEIVSFIDNWKIQYNHFSKIVIDTFPEG